MFRAAADLKHGQTVNCKTTEQWQISNQLYSANSLQENQACAPHTHGIGFFKIDNDKN